MIPFDFEYYRPASIEEAVQLFSKLYKEGKKPLYYSGGTEIITYARLNLVSTEAVIDIKYIPACHTYGSQQGFLILGAALTLTQISDMNAFPLLSTTASRIADHTARNKITLGGNIAGDIPYREAVLPFLLTNSTFVIAGMGGIRYVPAKKAFQGQLQLYPGEFLVQIATPAEYANAPFYSVKKRKNEEIDYPLITLAAIKTDFNIRTAYSGLCEFPFCSEKMDRQLNNKNIPREQRIERAVASIPNSVRNDIRGSREYRLFVLRNMLQDALTELEGVEV
ncbi:MAG: xanthine dehydrogenase family protein subunit M [Ectobacillus sp.]